MPVISYPGFPRWTDFRPRGGVHRADRPVGPLVHSSFTLADQLNDRTSGEAWGRCDPVLLRLVTLTGSSRDTTARPLSAAHCSAPGPVLRITSGAMQVARCARGSAHRGAGSSGSRPVYRDEEPGEPAGYSPGEGPKDEAETHCEGPLRGCRRPASPDQGGREGRGRTSPTDSYPAGGIDGKDGVGGDQRPPSSGCSDS